MGISRGGTRAINPKITLRHKPRVTSPGACLCLSLTQETLNEPNQTQIHPSNANANMSSTSSSTEGGRKYKRIPAPKQQTPLAALGARRRTVRHSSTVPSLNKKQSSLTQMQWIGTPRGVVDISSDDDDDEYEERPAKKQKTSAKKAKKSKFSKRAPDQNSFTQMPYLEMMRQPRRATVDKDGFQRWQDSETDEEFGSSSPAPGAGLSTSTPETVMKAEQPEDQAPEIAESSQGVSTQSQQNDSRDSAPSQKTLPLRTPQKVRFVEVPSPHTPTTSRPKPVLRSRSASRSPLKERSVNAPSPMKTQQSPETQHLSMKMLERVRFKNQQRACMRQQRQAGNYTEADLEQCAAEATDEFSLRTCPMLPPPRALQRKSTVEDSQAEEDDISLSMANSPSPKLVRTVTIGDSQRNSSNETLAEDTQVERPSRMFRRVGTIQDSQAEESDFDFDDDVSLTAHPPAVHAIQEDGGGHETQHEDFGDGTYDPAFSALDRDATRFEWTQTQKHRSQMWPSQEIVAGGVDSVTEDEDLDRGCASRLPPQHIEKPVEDVDVPMPLPSPTRRIEDKLGGQTPRKRAVETSLAEDALRDDGACESAEQMPGSKGVLVPSSPPPPRDLVPAHEMASNTKETQVPTSPPPPQHLQAAGEKTSNTDGSHVPSSPPPLRPSQVSTVVPTQMSMPPVVSSPRKKIKAEPFSLPPTPRHLQKSQPFGFLRSPQKTWQPESLSSSPMPLPPWSSPEKHRFVQPCREGDDGDASFELGSQLQMDSLADFSLPPPPPLSSSSRRGTPASSSL